MEKEKRIPNGSMTIAERDGKMAEAIRLHGTGMRVREIAKKVGVDKTTVYKWFNHNGVKVGDGARKYDLDLIDKIAEMYQTMTRQEIADALGMKYANVMYIINSNYIRKGEYLEG